MSETLDIADFPRLTPSDETALIAFGDKLPAGWEVAIEGVENAEWTAHVYHRAEPSAWSQFLVIRWANHVGLGVRLVEGPSFASVAFEDVQIVFDLIRSGIFVGLEAPYGIMRVAGGSTTHH